ncbi:hypothetical protein K8R78_06120 [bacterium]|nr:hypothetical protein [bacterium]
MFDDTEPKYTLAGFVPLLGLLGALGFGLLAWFAFDWLKLPGIHTVLWVRLSVSGLAAVIGLLFLGLPSTIIAVPEKKKHIFMSRDIGIALGKLALLAWFYIGLPWVTSWFTGGYSESVHAIMNLGASGAGSDVIWDIVKVGTFTQSLVLLALLPLLYLAANTMMAFLSSFDSEMPGLLKALVFLVCGPLTLVLGLGGAAALFFAIFMNFIGSIGLLLILLGFLGATAAVIGIFYMIFRKKEK